MARTFSRLSSYVLGNETGMKAWGQKLVEKLESEVDQLRISASWVDPTDTLTASDAGADATITIADHTRYYGDGTSVSLTGGSITGLSFSTTYYVYYVDTTLADTTPTFLATTDSATAASNATTGVHLVGVVTTPANGATSTLGIIKRILGDDGASSSTPAAVTFNDSGAGAASPTTFNGGTAKTISYNTIGAAASGHNHTGTYQPLDTQLTDLAGLSYTGNAAKVVAVNAGENGFELVAQTGGGSGISDGDYGDIVVSGSGTALNFDTGVVTAFAKTFLDDANAAAVLTTLGAQPLDTDLTSLSGLTLSQGDILYRDSSQLQRLAAGTSGQVLQTAGSGANPSWATPGMVYIGSYSPSAVSSLDIENFAGLSNRGMVVIDIEYLTVSADSIGITAQFKLNGAYKTSNYQWGRRNVFNGVGSNNSSTSDSSISIFLTGAGGMGNQSGEGGSGIIEQLNPYDTAGRKRLVYRNTWIDDQATPRFVFADGAGSYSSTDFANALGGVRLATSSGTMSGKVHVYARAYT